MLEKDPFVGVWRLNPATSQLTASPRAWVQTISVDGGWIDVHEEIVRADGSSSKVAVRARFDGRDYPVTGTALVDSMAYSREGNTIVGTGKKNGVVSLRESMTADDVQMIADLSIYLHEQEVVKGIANFHKVAGEPTVSATSSRH